MFSALFVAIQNNCPCIDANFLKGDSSEGEEVARILELTLEVDSRAERDMEAFLAM